jgi:hypothetical protein
MCQAKQEHKLKHIRSLSYHFIYDLKIIYLDNVTYPSSQMEIQNT